MEKIIWQPNGLYHPGYDFGILLDRQFAEGMLETKITLDKQNRMNEMANETMKRFGAHGTFPLVFHEDSALVTSFNLGERGRWLVMDDDSKLFLLNKTDKERCISYSSHNVDYSSDAYALIALVDQWVEYSGIIRE